MEGKPERDDAVMRFLERHRDRYPKGEVSPECDVAYYTIDDMLTRYRDLADNGFTLDEEERLL